LVHLWVARVIFVIGRGRCGNDGGIHYLDLAQKKAALGQMGVVALEQRGGELMLFAMPTNSRMDWLSCRVSSTAQSAKLTPLLEEVHAQHAVNPNWLAGG
jgi:hypothetical protein